MFGPSVDLGTAMAEMALSDRVVSYDVGGEGPTVVLCHNMGVDRSIYADQVAALAPGHTVVSFDMRGHGATGLGRRAPSIEVLADDLGELVEALGIAEAHFVGQSIGAMTLLAFASRNAFRHATYLVMSGAAKGDSAWDARYVDRAARVERFGLENAAELAGLSISPESQRRDPTLVDRYASMLAACPREGYAWACQAMVGLDLWDHLSDITAPVLLAAGSDDRFTPLGESRAISSRIAGSEVTEIPGVGHLPCIERPDFVSALIRDWVAAHPVGPA